MRSGRHDGAVMRAAPSAPTGAPRSPAGEDNRVIVWNVGRAASGETLEGHTAQVTGLAISRDGRTLYTAALDGKVIVWDLAGARRLGRPFAIGPDNPYQFPAYALRSDGRVLADRASATGRSTLIDARTLRPLSTFRAVPHGPVLALGLCAAQPAARRRRRQRLPRPRTTPYAGKLVARLRGHGGPLVTPSFSADGRLMATSSLEAIMLFALRSGEPVARPVRSSVVPLGDAALSPDGRTLAIVHQDQGVEILDVATLRRRTWLSQSESLTTIRFTPDGRYVVGGSLKGWARLWSTKTGRPASQVLAGHAGGVIGLAVSPDGDTLAVGSIDGSRPAVRPGHPAAARRAAARRAQQSGYPTVHAGRRLPVCHHQRRTRLPLGCAAVIVGARRLRRGRANAHPNRMAGRPTRSPLCARLHALEAQAGACE